MNIRNFFNKIRSINNTELVLPSELASIPMRDKISIDKIQELSEYKDNYRELLLKNKNLFSNEISIKYFNDEMLMNFNLFSNLIVNHDEIFNLYTTPEYIKKEKYIHRIVNPIKIKLYIDKMHELYEETHLRLIALKELYDEIESRKIIISRHNKEILVNEIYNLTTNYVIFANNVYAALKEVETYRNELQTEINFDEKTRDEIIKNYYDKIVNYVKKLIPDKLYQISNMSIDIVSMIAYLERELEIYVYNNIKVDELNQELTQIDNIPKTLDNREMLLEKINVLEIKYIVLNDYGRYELDLGSLYEVKFDILTIDIINQKKSPFTNIKDNRVIEYYSKVIKNRIVTYITGNDSLLEHKLKEDDKHIISAIYDILPIFGYQVLESLFLLNLVLSMRSLETAKYFFKNYKVDITHVDEDRYIIERNIWLTAIRNIFNFTNDKGNLRRFPLATLCRLYSLYFDEKPRYLERYMAFAEMYKVFVGNNKSDKLYVPEGIESINLNCDLEALRNNIAKRINNKKVIMPSTMREIDVNYLDNYLHNSTVPEIVLNEGLECIYGNIDLGKLKTEKLTIPSTLFCISPYDGNFYPFQSYVQVPRLIFTKFEKSTMLTRYKKDRNLMLRVKCEMSIKELWDDRYNKYVKINDKWIITEKPKLSPNTIHLISSSGFARSISIDSVVKKTFLADLSWLDASSLGKIMASNIVEKVITKCSSFIDEAIDEATHGIDNTQVKTRTKSKRYGSEFYEH